MRRWRRSPGHARRPPGARVVSSSSPASRGSARPRSSPASCATSRRGRGCSSAPATTCSIPRPLGPIRDLAGSVSPPLEQALSAGAAPHDDPAPADRRAGRRRGRRCSCSRTCTGRTTRRSTRSRCSGGGSARCRRCSCSPSAAARRPGHPLHAALGAIRADDSLVIELAPLSERAVASLAGDDAARSTPPPAATRSTSPSCSPRTARRSCRRRSRTPCSGAPPGSTTTRAGWSSWSRSCRTACAPRCWTPSCPTGRRRRRSRSAASCSRSTPAHVRFRHELARNAIQAEHPDRRAGAGSTRDPRGAARRGRRPGRHRPPRRGGRRRGRRRRLRAGRGAPGGRARLQPRGLLALPARRRLRRPPAAPEQAALLEELATAAYVVGRLDDAFSPIERAIGIHRDLGDPEAVGRCTRFLSRLHWYAGDGEPARAKAREAIAILEPLGESVELARAYSGLSQLAMLAEDAAAALSWGERALELATRLGDRVTRAHALVNLGRRRCSSIRPQRRRCSRRTPPPTPPASSTRRRARSATSATRCWRGCGPRRRCSMPSGRSPTASSTRCTRSRRTRPR